MTVDDANLELFGSPDEVDAPEGPPQHSLRAPGVGVPAGSEHATELFADEGAIGDVVDPDTENPDPLDPDTTAPDTGGPDSPHPDTTALETAARAANDEGSPRDAAVRLPPVWTVSMVNRRVRELVEGTVPPLWVRGEVANWTRARSGHRYFTLKDELAQIRAVMFRNDAERLPVDPDEGMTVRAFGSVTLYETRGEYQITVRTLEAEGDEGLWRIAFERVRLKLEKEGLLAAGRKRPLPRFPRCVGVVTSPTGAALRDVLSVINGRAPWTRVVVKSTRVQGDGAALEIAAAIDALARSGLADMVIVARGGGSIEDLWAFNDEGVARAIAACPVPVVSAIGHEVDVTIADLVADVRAPTPSAGAEAAVQDRAAILRQLSNVPPRLAAGLRRSVDRRRERVMERMGRLHRGVRGLIEPGSLRARDREERLERAVRNALSSRRHRLERASAKIDTLSPLATMRRGYAVPLDSAGQILRRVAAFSPGESFDLRVVDGRVACEVARLADEP